MEFVPMIWGYWGQQMPRWVFIMIMIIIIVIYVVIIIIINDYYHG